MFRYVIECPNCGVIYRSRQFWYGNQDPVDTVVRTEIQHVWPGVRETSSFINSSDYIFLIICHSRDLEIWVEGTLYLLKNIVCFLQSDGFLKDNSNAAQRLLDGVNLVAQSVSELSVKPAKAVTSWLTDQIAPAYWKPNSLILVSDTHSPTLCWPPPTAKSTLSSPELCLLSVALCDYYTIYVYAGHKITLR